MNSFLQSTAVFFKRYFFVVLVSMVIGNLIAWKNASKHENFYQTVIKVRSRVDYYDLVRTHFEKIAALAMKNNPGIKNIPIESYRNENFYFIEMKLQFADTIAISAGLEQVINLIRTDTELKDKYFDLLDRYNKLIAENKELVNEFGTGTANVNDLGFRKSLFELKMDLSALQHAKIEHEEKIEIYFPAANEFEFITTGNSSKSYLTASVLFFIIGLFIAVVIDRFRN